LIAVGMPNLTYRLDKDQAWVEQSGGSLPNLAGGAGSADRGQRFGTGRGGQRMPDVSALLDRQQFDLLTRSPDEHLLILGGAGCGKTTVALHRVAALNARAPKRFPAERMMVVVPDRGLVRLSRKILRALGLEKVKVTTYDDWIISLARHWLKSLPNRICLETPARISRFKRHPAMLEIFDSLERLRWLGFQQQAEKSLHFVGEIAEIFAQSNGRDLSSRLEDARRRCSAVVNHSAPDLRIQQQKTIDASFASMKKQLLNVDLDRRALYSDRALLMRAVSMSDGALTEGMVDEILRHSRTQFSEPDDHRHLAPVGDEAIISLDGVDVVNEESQGVEGTVDIEDCSLMFRLLKHYTGSVDASDSRLPEFEHLVIDEAQELSPLELRMLGDCLSTEGSVTIAGDAAQQSDPTTTFVTWEHVLRELDIGDVSATQLRTNYRSPRPIAEYAHQILGPIAPAEMPRALRDGSPVVESQCSDFGHLAMILTETLEDLCLREPEASVAIICRDYESAAQIFTIVKDLDGVRFIRDGDFEFEAGIDVAEVSQVKGLEFDYVIIPDGDINNYPDLPEARRLLHVAATRAMHQLWVLCVGRASPILSGKK
jgi:DNA helicase-2/ATP-dependent DNA helicase PcrA